MGSSPRLLRLRWLALPVILLAACSDSSTNTGDLCAEMTCGANAHCAVDGAGAAACLCDDGFTADATGVCVATPIGVCNPNPCTAAHQTACQDLGDGGYACSCEEGYAPTAAGGCAPTTVDACDPNPCIIPHQTECVADGAGGFTCDCDAGWLPNGAGGCMPDPADPCTPNPCFVPFQTQCADGGGFPICSCDPGYEDDGFGGCTPTSFDPCDPNPCVASHETTCTDAGGFPECACDSGYHYDAFLACVADDPCDPNPCAAPHKTTCQVASGGAVCLCDEGFVDNGAGTCVSVVADPCDPNPCDAPHRGVCTADGANASCTCDPDFSENASGECVPDSDPCDPNPCTDDHRTACTPNGAAASCACDPGFSEDDQGACVAVVEAPCDPNPCTDAHRTSCSPSGDQAVCACDDGYHDDGQGACTNDPCLPNPCDGDHQTQCSASGGGVVCGCDADYQPDGAGGCEPAADNPCDPNPCDLPLQTVCNDVGGAPVCSCDPGAHDDGQGACTVSPCLPNPCDAPHEAQCTPDPGTTAGYTCGCDPDYYPGVDGCVDACVADPCEEPFRTSCVAVDGASVCSCDPGYHEDGQGGCTNDPCVPDPCGADEVCEGTLGTSSHACVPCLDKDDDGYGVGAGCLGPDCDDTSDAIFDGCACPAAHGDGDAFEEDECFFIAASIASGDTQSHSIAPAGDVDWLVFTVAAGDMVRLIKSTGGPAQRMTLVDRDGTTEIETKYTGTGSSLFIDRKLPAGGDWFVLLEGAYASTVGDYGVTFDNLGQDDHGDTPEDATPIVAGAGGVPGAFEIGGNIDWFSFDVIAGHAYQIWVTPTGSGVVMRLYDQNGTTLLETRESSYSNVAMIDRGELEAGTHYVRLAANYGTGNLGDYTISVVDLGLDDHGDGPEDATLIATDGVDVAGTFEVGGNTDFFAFDVVAGHMYQMWCESTASTGIVLRLYDQNGTSLMETSEASYTNPAFIDRGVLSAGRYYLRVNPNYGNAATGDYRIRVVDLGLDDHGDGPDDATALGASGTVTSGTFEVGYNSDWFAFDVAPGHMVQLWAKSLASTGVVMRLYDQDGTSLLETSEASYNNAAFIDRGTLDAGTYYLRLTPNYGNASTGDYEVWIVDLGLDDHGGSPATATHVATDDVPVGGLFQVGGNVDWFSFDVVAGHQYQLRCVPVASVGCNLRLYDQDGETFIESSASSYTNTAFIDRGTLAAGTYYFRVNPNYGSVSTGAYEVRVTDLGLDDHGNSPSDATPVAADDTPVAGLFEVGDNIDWFSFVVAPGHQLQVRCTPTESTGCILRIYDQDGATLVETSSSSYSNTAFIDRGELSAGTYYLRVSPNYGARSTGAYEVRITDLGLDDHGDDAATATALTVGGAATNGVFEVGGNIDWFSFSATSGTSYSIVCDPVASVGCSARLYDTNGETGLKSWSSSYSSAATTTWTAPASGTYYLRVMPNYGSASTGGYTVSVTAQ
ncbi:MAG: hypothetical protein EP329_28475 [Deltaproteobacteria bacterium]|nr:MAG: hypothetical protein EP329_28475 [Deltaproteobacteria bacterium]